MKKQITLLISLVVITINGIQAQKTIPASGGEASGSEGTVSYTVGQIAYSTNSGTTGTVAEGIQQPYEILVITGIEHNEISLETITAFPNPATDYLILNIAESESYSGQYLISLYDINGSLLKTQKITVSETKIEMSQYSTGTYFLHVLSRDQVVRNFKIIKQ